MSSTTAPPCPHHPDARAEAACTSCGRPLVRRVLGVRRQRRAVVSALRGPHPRPLAGRVSARLLGWHRHAARRVLRALPAGGRRRVGGARRGGDAAGHRRVPLPAQQPGVREPQDGGAPPQRGASAPGGPGCLPLGAAPRAHGEHRAARVGQAVHAGGAAVLDAAAGRAARPAERARLARGGLRVGALVADAGERVRCPALPGRAARRRRAHAG
jgi:hypothetical protein